ncbi:MAG TPA: divalent-cation tolerance protein CutA [Blastocatellia bacterium]|nr:divalent-cation tolerance protein CutA [Blastocatellia bacterium]
MNDALIVLVTAPNVEEASRIADALVGGRLAACVNIVGGIESVYRWEGRVARDSEVLMIIKTTDARYAELEAQVKALHSYTTPEVIALRIERGTEAYLQWLGESVTP